MHYLPADNTGFDIFSYVVYIRHFMLCLILKWIAQCFVYIVTLQKLFDYCLYSLLIRELLLERSLKLVIHNIHKCRLFSETFDLSKLD